MHVSLEISVFFQDSKSQDEEIAWRFKKTELVKSLLKIHGNKLSVKKKLENEF